MAKGNLAKGFYTMKQGYTLRGGLSIIEVVIAFSILMMVVLSQITAMYQAHTLAVHTHNRDLVLTQIDTLMEEIQAAPFVSIAAYHGAGYSVAGVNVGTAQSAVVEVSAVLLAVGMYQITITGNWDDQINDNNSMTATLIQVNRG